MRRGFIEAEEGGDSRATPAIALIRATQQPESVRVSPRHPRAPAVAPDQPHRGTSARSPETFPDNLIFIALAQKNSAPQSHPFNRLVLPREGFFRCNASAATNRASAKWMVERRCLSWLFLARIKVLTRRHEGANKNKQEISPFAASCEKWSRAESRACPSNVTAEACSLSHCLQPTIRRPVH